MKKHCLVLILLILIAAALPLSAGAEKSGACGDKLKWTLTSSGVLTVSGTGNMTDYEQSANTAPWGKAVKQVKLQEGVASIGKNAFYGCASLTGVTVPDSVKSIGDYAFSGCAGLTDVKLGKAVVSIGDYAFSDCVSLKKATIPDSVTGIGGCAFYRCAKLTDAVIGGSVASIGGYAFCDCGSLKKITIPGSVKSIGSAAFARCANLAEVTFGKGVKTIDAYAFYDCDSLTAISLGNSVASIGAYAFYSCGSLTDVKLGSGVKSISDYAFYYCGIKSITFSDSVETIGENAFDLGSDSIIYAKKGSKAAKALGKLDYAFREPGSQIELKYIYENNKLSRLEAVGADAGIVQAVIPDGVAAIGKAAFSDCGSLTKVTIPSSVVSIAEKAFYNCTGLTAVTVPDSVVSIGNRAFYHCGADFTMHCGIGSAALQYAKEYGYIMSVTIPQGVTGIDGKAFYDCARLLAITIPDSVTDIGDSAFFGCTGLKTVTIPGSVKSIGEDAFAGCTGLTSVKILNGVKTIGPGAFYKCTGLTGVTLPNSVTTIGAAFERYDFYDYRHGAFANCDSLTDVTLGSGLKSIGGHTFSGCASLKSATMTGSVVTVGVAAFYKCGSLESVTLPNSVKSIGEYAFSGCGSLTGAALGKSAESIGSHTFSGCSHLKSVTIPGTVTSIGEDAFSDCSSLTAITLPKSVAGIGRNAFHGCTGLKKITIPSTVTSIEGGVFSGCTGLKSVTMPNSVTSISPGAFSGCSSLTAITIPKGVASIGSGIFTGCTGLKSLTIQNGVTSIGSSAFADSPALYLVNISLPDSVTSIGANAFGFTVPGIAKSDVKLNAKVIKKAKQVLNDVIQDGMTDDQKALALHDYLISHANYDYSFTYYHPDGVLLHGKGVCNSYAEAFSLLLNGVGIPTRYEYGDNHIWNVVKLGGSWCHIDTTWDDPGKGGHERHNFFGVTDFALEGVSNHEREKREQSCTNYQLSYAYKNGTLSSIVDGWRKQIHSSLAANDYSFTLSGNLDKADGMNTRMAYEMLQDETFMIGGIEEKPKLDYQDHHTYKYGENVQDTSFTGGTYRITVTFAEVKPAIAAQPQDVTVNEGKTAAFTVTATGAKSYQWFYRKSADDEWRKVSSSGDSASCSIDAKAGYNGYQYRCLVKNSVGSVYTDPATLTVNPKPVLTAQPKDVKVTEGEKAAFRVKAANAKIYQWYTRKSASAAWQKVAENSASATLSFTAQAKQNGHQFRCLVKNDVGSAYSGIVTLTVRLLPAISAQPKSSTVDAGKKVAFKVTANRTDSYQWFFRKSASASWQKVSESGTAASLSFTAKANQNGWQYRCLLKNSNGSAYTDIVTLTVNPVPVITGQPKSAAADAGKKVTFKVTASQTDSYQWYTRKSASSVWQKVSDNGTAAALSFIAKANQNGHQYRCLLKNSSGSVYTGIVTLTVNPVPVITAQPKAATVTAGKTAAFTVTATGADSYQWYYRKSSSGTWQKVSDNGAAATLKLTAKAGQNGWQYRCLLKNSAGSVYTNPVTLTVE